MKRKILVLILTILIMFSSIPVSASPAKPPIKSQLPIGLMKINVTKNNDLIKHDAPIVVIPQAIIPQTPVPTPSTPVKIEIIIPAAPTKAPVKRIAETYPVGEGYSPDIIIQKIRQKFGKNAEHALRIANCESGYQSIVGDKHLTPHSYGVFQIRGLEGRPSPSWLMNADNNIDYAFGMSDGGNNFSAWSCR